MSCDLLSAAVGEKHYQAPVAQTELDEASLGACLVGFLGENDLRTGKSLRRALCNQAGCHQIGHPHRCWSRLAGLSTRLRKCLNGPHNRDGFLE